MVLLLSELKNLWLISFFRQSVPLQFLLDDSLSELKTALITLVHQKNNNNNAIYLSVNVLSTKVLMMALLLHLLLETGQMTIFFLSYF